MNVTGWACLYLPNCPAGSTSAMGQYCADNNVPIYGSYDPACIEGLQETDFFDGLHCGGTGIARFFPGIPQALSDLQNGTLANPLDVHPRTSLEDPNAQPAEGETTDGEVTPQEG